MTYVEHYSNYKWIKVKRFERIEENSWEDNYNRLERHHTTETSFMIAEIRKLAALLDEKQAIIESHQSPQTSGGMDAEAVVEGQATA